MSKLDKKQRHKARRDAKRREARRRDAISPIKRLADAPGETEYWLSDAFESFHQAQVYVYKRAAGLSGIAVFLIDQGVVGLKDAWTRMGIEHSEFREYIDNATARGISMRRASLEEVRNLIAGGIRWAHENGMRLPKEWVKPAMLLGGINDWMTADVSRFTKEFAGHPEDLRQRLIREPFESYVRRTDVRLFFSDAAPVMDQRTGRYIDSPKWEIAADEFEEDEGEEEEDEEESMPVGVRREQFAALAEKIRPLAVAMAAKTEAWVASRGETPAPRLGDAWNFMLLAHTMSFFVSPYHQEEQEKLSTDFLEGMIHELDETNAAEVTTAIKQVSEHTAADPEMMRGMFKEPHTQMDEVSGDTKINALPRAT